MRLLEFLRMWRQRKREKELEATASLHKERAERAGREARWGKE